MASETHESGSLSVEVAYGLPDRQFLVKVEVREGSTVSDVIECSGLREAYPDVEIDPQALGIFSRKVAPDHPVQHGDRVEVYRPLAIDPMEARRLRAEANRPS